MNLLYKFLPHISLLCSIVATIGIFRYAAMVKRRNKEIKRLRIWIRYAAETCEYAGQRFNDLDNINWRDYMIERKRNLDIAEYQVGSDAPPRDSGAMGSNHQ